MMRVRSFAFLGIVVFGSSLAACSAILGDFTVSGDVSDGGGDGTTGGEGGVDGAGDGAQQPDSPSDGGGGDAEAGCTGLVCNGTCVPNDRKNCGTCGHDCTNLPHVSGLVSCRSNGMCAFTTSACAPGFDDCNMMPDDGCEADLSKTSHCGTCSTMCSGGTPVCTGMGTAFMCASGCSGTMPTLCSGTCVDLNTNAQNCRMCGTVCPNVANGQPGCAAGACGIGTCNVNFQDCNMLASDGCEVNTQTDPQHCGACAGAVCNLPNATSGCAGGTCTVATCNGGFANCDTMASNGCEVNTNTDNANCGGCGAPCSGGKTCQGGSCLCPSGRTLCGGVCVDLQSDGANCNACGRDCQGGACSNGVCKPVIFVAAALTSSINDIASDGTVVVWSDNGNSTIDEVATLGGAKIVLGVSGIVSGPRAIAIAPNGNGNVSWMQFDGTNTRQGLAHVGMAGSGALSTSLGGVTNGLVYDPNGTVVYTTRTLSPTTTLMSCASGGGCNSLFSVTSGQASFDLAFGGGFVVFGDVSNSSVIQYKLSSGTSTAVTAQTSPYRVGADGAYAWWVQGSSQNLLTRANLGSTATTTVTMAAGTPIASDGAYVYFVAASGINYIPVGGGAVVSWVTGLSAGHLKVAAGALYFDAGGAIYRVKTP